MYTQHLTEWRHIIKAKKQKKSSGEWNNHYLKTNWRRRMMHIFGMAKVRAKRKNRPCDIDIDWIMQQLETQGYCCAVTGLPLRLTCPKTGNAFNSRSPSLERIDSFGGYTKTNTLVVCYMYNACKNQFDDADVTEFCRAFLNTNRGL